MSYEGNLVHAKDNMDSMRRWTSGWGAVPGEEAVEAEEDSVGASERKWYFDNNRKKVAWSLLSQPPVDPHGGGLTIVPMA